MSRLFKYHGLGNDFVIVDRRASGVETPLAWAQAVCDRRLGVGADGVLTLLPSSRAAARMVVHNADGSVPEMCGNGLRCAVKYLADNSGQPKEVAVETGAGVLVSQVSYANGEASEIEVAMGPARLFAPALTALEGFPGSEGTAVSMGNPHWVMFGRPLEEATTLGPKLEVQAQFPARANIGFAQLKDDRLDLAVWERGAGLTQACGTGACAAVAAAVHLGKRPAETWHRVRLPGGELRIWVKGDLSEVRMRGPAAFVFAFELAQALAPEAKPLMHAR